MLLPESRMLREQGHPRRFTTTAPLLGFEASLTRGRFPATENAQGCWGGKVLTAGLLW